MLFVVAKCWRQLEVHLGDSSFWIMLMILPPSKSAVVSYDIGIADLEANYIFCNFLVEMSHEWSPPSAIRVDILSRSPRILMGKVGQQPSLRTDASGPQYLNPAGRLIKADLRDRIVKYQASSYSSSQFPFFSGSKILTLP